MRYDDQVAKICRLQNAWEVEIYDKPKEQKSKNGMVSYQDPWKSYAFATAEEVLKFLGERLDKLKPRNSEMEYEEGFQEATSKAKPKK